MEGSQYLMWMRRKQILTSSHSQLLQAAPIGDGYSSWEERAFAEDAARILGAAGSMWPPRSYTCNFCKREFRSAQALGGHMNIHRRDRARLKQNLSPHNNDHDATLELDHNHRKNDDFKQFSSLGNHHFSAEIIDCSLKPYSSPATTVTTNRTISPSRLSVSTILSPNDSSSSTIWGVQKMGSSPNSEPAGGVLVNARKEDNFKELGCNTSNHVVETSLSVGLTSMFGQKSLTFPCGDNKAIMSCKRLKTTTTTTTISSVLPPPVFFKPCNSKDSNRCLALQPAEIVIGDNNPGMEDLDLELRLGKQQKVN